MASSSSGSKNNSSTALPITDKLKVLALHGYRQTGDDFYKKTGSFRKFISRYAEVRYITAPHQSPPIDDDSDPAAAGNSWWFNKDDGTFKGTNQNGPAIGFEESLKMVEEVWREQGPFQGLIGFSQGACFVGLLCSLAARNLTVVQPRFVVLSSGFKSGSLAHSNYYERKIPIPSLHTYGEADQIIPKEMSLKLADCFEDPAVLAHEGGHCFPGSAKHKETYVTFFQDHLQDYLEAKELENGK